MISSQTASVGGSEVFPLKRTLLGQAGARTADAPSKKDLLAALGQNSEGDSVGAIEKASRAQAQVDGAEDGSAADSFASAVAPFLQTAPGVQRASAGAGEGGDALAQAGNANAARDGNGANTVSPDLSAGRLNSQMLSVLLQHQAA